MYKKYKRWYCKKSDKKDAEYRTKHGDVKFLNRAIKDYKLFCLTLIIIVIYIVVHVSVGILYTVTAEYITVFFVASIFSLSLCAVFILFLIPYITFLMPFHKARAIKAK